MLKIAKRYSEIDSLVIQIVNQNFFKGFVKKTVFYQYILVTCPDRKSITQINLNFQKNFNHAMNGKQNSTNKHATSNNITEKFLILPSHSKSSSQGPRLRTTSKS